MIGALRAYAGPLIAGALIASHFAAVGWGYRQGGTAVEARHAAAVLRTQQQLHRAAEALSVRALDLDRALDALRSRAMEAEDDARANPDPCRLPATDSLHRLQRRWSAP